MTAHRSVYQLHPGAWLRRADAAAPPLSNPRLDQALADTLVPYVRNLGFTHIELLSSPSAVADAAVVNAAVIDEAAADDAAALAAVEAEAALAPPSSTLPRLAARCRDAGLGLLPPGSSAVLVAASEDGIGFDDPWRTGLAAELRRHLPRPGSAPNSPALPDRLQRFALLRARMALMWAQPGAKRVAMGSEFAQQRPWSMDGGLDWHLLADPLHEGVQRLLHDLHRLCDDCEALREPAADRAAAQPGSMTGIAGPGGVGGDAPAAGFWWIERDNVDSGVLAFSRVAVDAPSAVGRNLAAGAANPGAPESDPAAAPGRAPALLVAANLSPIAQASYRFGVPLAGRWVERICTGSVDYGGRLHDAADAAGADAATRRWPNGGVAVTEAVAWNGHAQSLVLTLPARTALILERRR